MPIPLSLTLIRSLAISTTICGSVEFGFPERPLQDRIVGVLAILPKQGQGRLIYLRRKEINDPIDFNVIMELQLPSPYLPSVERA